MNWFNKMSLKFRILVIVALSCIITSVVAVGVSIYFNHKELEEGIIAKAETIHSRLEAVTDYVAQQGGLKPIIDRTISQYQSSSQLSDKEKLEILKQVPIFAAMKVAAKDDILENYNFRVFSDEPRNKDNKASEEELAIFNSFVADPSLKQQVSNDGKFITVFRPVRLQESQGCLNCHGDPKTSPWKDGTDILGHKMENWKDGKLHGVFALKTDVTKVLEAKSKDKLLSSTSLLAIFIALGGIIALILASIFIRGPISRLLRIIGVLEKTEHEIGSASQETSASAIGLSNSSTEQASSIQETASAIEELNSIVNRTSDSAKNSSSLAEKNKEATELGQKTVQEMMRSMQAIDNSNQNILSTVNSGNQKISEIVKVISEIGSKTKVINDIVFQTKLLSFNASVEAARAGEHGKGFAVVAEEVGKLAQMSGNAAKEISSLLDESIQKVENIVSETKSNVESSAAQAKSKIESGNKMAQECGSVFDEIVKSVQAASLMSTELFNASKEQVQGLSEISKAMSQLDQVAQSNSGLSNDVSKASTTLATQTTELNQAFHELHQLIHGSNKARTKTKTQANKPENVVSFKKADQGKGKDAKTEVKTESKVEKKVVGGSDTPSPSDPRFEDV